MPARGARGPGPPDSSAGMRAGDAGQLRAAEPPVTTELYS
eukprot:COSAG01_NODE_931_length_12617_cov_20.567163_5_plen_40_part_00